MQLGQFVDNRPNIKKTQIIELGITTTTYRKTIKYTDFKNILKREWGLKNVSLIPVVMEVTGMYRKSLHREFAQCSG